MLQMWIGSRVNNICYKVVLTPLFQNFPLLLSSHGAKELLENVAIGRNDDVEAFVAEVNKAIPEVCWSTILIGTYVKYIFLSD